VLKIIGFLVIALALGAGLAWLDIATGRAVGGIGALALVAWAILARRRWRALQDRDGSEPGAPERVVWQRFAGHALLCGHLGFTLLNPQYDLHVGSGNYLAIDNWTLILGLMLSALVFRADRNERDERDDRIDARATRWGYGALIGFLIVLLLYMGFAPRNMQTALTHFLLANLLIELIIASAVVRQAMQLFGYSRDREGPL